VLWSRVPSPPSPNTDKTVPAQWCGFAGVLGASDGSGSRATAAGPQILWGMEESIEAREDGNKVGGGETDCRVRFEG
jgi:hypothetical protein